MEARHTTTTGTIAPRTARETAEISASWLRLWMRTAMLGLLLLLVLFGGYEVIERRWLPEAPPALLHRLHLARGMGAALCLASWAFLSIREARREVDDLLRGNVLALELAVQHRTRELEQAHALVELLFDSLPERLIVRDPAGHVVKTNRVARDNVANEEEVLWEIEVIPVPTTDGSGELSLELARDVTRQRKLEAQLRHQEKMAGLGLLAAGIAHDLGNPLASIASELELLEGEQDATRFHASLPVLQRHMERIGRTLREMTEFARRRRDGVTDVVVDAAIRDSLRLVRHDPRWKRVELDLRLASATPSVRLVEDHLVLVLINLMLNAVDAMPAGGTLRVITSRVGSGTEIRVQDTGTGMTPDVLRNAMKPLFTTKDAHHGTGLGLSVSHEVVRSAGGTLQLHSQPGQGTEVVIWLPGNELTEAPPWPNES